MNTHEICGYTFSRPRNPRKYSANSRNSKHKSRICQEEGLRSWDQTMVKNIPLHNSMISARKQELRGSSQFPTTLNKMGLQKGRTKQLWRQPMPWYMTRVYRCSYRQMHPKQLFMYKTNALIKSWRTWLQKNPSQKWSQKWATFVSLAAQSTFTCQG